MIVVWSSDEPVFLSQARLCCCSPGRSRARAVGDHFLVTALISLYSIFNTSNIFSVVSLGSSSVALGNASLLPFIAVSPLFFLSFPHKKHHIPKQLQKSWPTVVCMEAAVVRAFNPAICVTERAYCVNPAICITERVYCVNCFSKR